MVAGSPEDFVTVGWVVLGVLGRFSLSLTHSNRTFLRSRRRRKLNCIRLGDDDDVADDTRIGIIRTITIRREMDGSAVL